MSDNVTIGHVSSS